MVDQGMILGWRSPINPLNSPQGSDATRGNTSYLSPPSPLPRAGTRSSGAVVIPSEGRWPRGPDISGHLILFYNTTPA